jgi:hypothetical protein
MGNNGESLIKIIYITKDPAPVQLAIKDLD